MRHRHEMNFRRQELIIGVIPPLGGEYAELAAVHNLADAILHAFIIRRGRPRHLLGKGFRFQRRRPMKGKSIGA